MTQPPSHLQLARYGEPITRLGALAGDVASRGRQSSGSEQTEGKLAERPAFARSRRRRWLVGLLLTSLTFALQATTPRPAAAAAPSNTDSAFETGAEPSILAGSRGARPAVADEGLAIDPLPHDHVANEGWLHHLIIHQWWVWLSMLAGSSLLLAALLAFGYVVRLNRRLAAEVRESGRRFDKLKKLEQSLALEQRRLNAVLEAIPAVVYLETPDHQIVYTNRHFHDAIGNPADRRCYEVVRQRQTPCKECPSRTVLATGEPRQWEYSTPGGRRFKMHASRFLDVDGSPLILKLGVDVTELNRAEEELKRFRLALDVAPDAIFLIDHESMRNVDVNDTACNSLGYNREELLEMGPADIVEDFDFATLNALLAESAQSRTPSRLKVHKHRRKDGSRFPVEVNVQAFRSQGRMMLVATARDISQREKADRERTRLIDTIELASDTVGSADAHGNVIYMNQSGRRLLGYGPDQDLRHVHIADQHPPWAARLLTNVALPIAREQGQWVGETAVYSWDGRELPTSQAIVAHREPDGTVEFYSTIIRDISEQKRVEQELKDQAQAMEAANMALEQFNLAAQAATRAKSEFLANMSHEIRTPMTAILGYADLLAEESLDAEQAKTYIRTIQRNGRSLLALINDILDLSKIEAGKMTTEPISCSVWQAVEEVLSMMRVRADDKGLNLQARFHYPLPATIHTDPIRLRQILINLLGNAVKFTQEGSVELEVELCRREDRSRMVFRIRDTGIGMTEQQIGKLFSPFTQADTSTTRRFGGTGLGLTISKRLAGVLGGDITVRSQPREGSVFTLEIDPGPLADVPMLDRAPDGPPNDPANGPTNGPVPSDAFTDHQLRGHVLLAEDGPDNQRLISLILRKAGLKVDIAENGELALHMVARSEIDGQPYDLVLMDIQMPRLDGFQATAELRRRGWSRPIVALTANAMTGDREKCLAAGCDDYTTKPVNRAELLGIVARHLEAIGASG